MRKGKDENVYHFIKIYFCLLYPHTYIFVYILFLLLTNRRTKLKTKGASQDSACMPGTDHAIPNETSTEEYNALPNETNTEEHNDY